MAVCVSKYFSRKSLLGYGALRAALPSLAARSKANPSGYVKEGSHSSRLGQFQFRALSQGHGEWPLVIALLHEWTVFVFLTVRFSHTDIRVPAFTKERKKNVRDPSEATSKAIRCYLKTKTLRLFSCD